METNTSCNSRSSVRHKVNFKHFFKITTLHIFTECTVLGYLHLNCTGKNALVRIWKDPFRNEFWMVRYSKKTSSLISEAARWQTRQGAYEQSHEYHLYLTISATKTICPNTKCALRQVTWKPKQEILFTKENNLKAKRESWLLAKGSNQCPSSIRHFGFFHVI